MKKSFKYTGVGDGMYIRHPQTLENLFLAKGKTLETDHAELIAMLKDVKDVEEVTEKPSKTHGKP